jgi:hypothetical protein
LVQEVPGKEMNSLVRKIILSAAVLICAYPMVSHGQCEIESRLDLNGIMYFYAEPVKVYWTSAKSLYCGAVTDKKDYYLQFYPNPFPEKPKGSIRKSPATVVLEDEKEVSMKNFDTWFDSSDSIFKMLFLIPEGELESFISNEILTVSLDMGDEEGVRVYTLKLHKDAIRQQLNCLISMDD